MDFDLVPPDSIPPDEAIMISPNPNSAVSTGTPTYTWEATPGSTWYFLWVVDVSTGLARHKQWYTAAQTNCAGGTGTCSITPSPSPAFAAGTYRWWIQGWNPQGFGVWSDSLDFTIMPSASVAPNPPTLIGPSGSFKTLPAAYSWRATPFAQRYTVSIDDSSGNRLLQVYTTSQAGCASGGACQISPGVALAAGAGSWKVQASNAAGDGAWSAPMKFAYGPPGTVPPDAATLVSPVGTTSVAANSAQQIYTWNAVPGATWYYLWINDSLGTIQKWYTSDQTGCAGATTGTCSIMGPAGLAAGKVSWWIQTWNSKGFGPWSTSMTFIVDASQASTTGRVPPGRATLVSPNGSTAGVTGAGQTYTWNAVDGATSYYLWVNDKSAMPRVTRTVTADEAGCAAGGTCSVTSNVLLPSGSASWWIQASNNAGSGPWSAAMTFVIQ